MSFARKLQRAAAEKKKIDYVIACTKCPMWFNTRKGGKAVRDEKGVPVCRECGSPLAQIPAAEFYKESRKKNMLDTIMAQEYPIGSHWKKKREEEAKKIIKA